MTLRRNHCNYLCPCPSATAHRQQGRDTARKQLDEARGLLAEAAAWLESLPTDAQLDKSACGAAHTGRTIFGKIRAFLHPPDPWICIECNLHGDHRECIPGCACGGFGSEKVKVPVGERHAFDPCATPPSGIAPWTICHREVRGDHCGKPASDPIHAPEPPTLGPPTHICIGDCLH